MLLEDADVAIAGDVILEALELDAPVATGCSGSSAWQSRAGRCRGRPALNSRVSVTMSWSGPAYSKVSSTATSIASGPTKGTVLPSAMAMLGPRRLKSAVKISCGLRNGSARVTLSSSPSAASGDSSLTAYRSPLAAHRLPHHPRLQPGMLVPEHLLRHRVRRRHRRCRTPRRTSPPPGAGPGG